MDKKNGDQGRSEILKIIEDHSHGVSLVDIINAMETPLLKRTLQRRLRNLREADLIFSVGRGRATRYFIKNVAELIPLNLTKEGYISVSTQADRVRQQIAKPINERTPVSYNHDFLRNYVPNQSYYLTKTTRAYLEGIGKQSGVEQDIGSFVFKILDRLLIDLSWNSSRLEGNTYSLLETERLIREGRVAEGKDLFETRMILNHKDAIEFLVGLGEELEFNQYIILNLHSLLAKNLLSDPRAPGRLRTIPVGIGKTVYNPLAIPQLIEEYFVEILRIANAIQDPFEQSFFAMVHLPYLQAFVDVNKRVSRLASNIPLIKNNLCPISFVDLPKQAYVDGMLGVYELNNVDLLAEVYVWAYEHSTRRYSEARAYLSEPDVFLEIYDDKIKQLVSKLVLQKLNKSAAIKIINEWAVKNVPRVDQEKFIEVVQNELLALHLGNIAKYKIKPKEFQGWQLCWNEKEK